ncbi:MAG: hypothetical protein D4R73_06265 [Deltaproteobacteria bacterium]|nr:MAG: hypothetical protein D4R73_06265 [Deltaproteobacteria bacterium]
MAIEEITTDKLQNLIQQPKHVTNPKARRRTEEKYERIDYEVTAQEGELKFRIYLRQNTTDPEDFSCGIRWVMPSGETLTLARYNGSNHIHHEIEFQCHIHRATEEAIRQGRKPEHHAEATKLFHTLDGALHCLLNDLKVSGLESHPDQAELF